MESNTERPSVGAGQRARREVLTVSDVAARIELRLHGPEVNALGIAEGCAFAGEAGLAAVTCRPEHVALAAGRLADSGVGVATALGFHDPASSLREPDALANEARALSAEGATDVALVSTRDADPSGLSRLLDQIAAVTEALDTASTILRVMLETPALSDAQLPIVCRRIGEAGVGLVQVGSWRGDRPSLIQMETMRAALPGEVLLKWTPPVRSIDVMLVCLALGADRFNGDARELLAAAARRWQLAPLTVPLAGLDF